MALGIQLPEASNRFQQIYHAIVLLGNCCRYTQNTKLLTEYIEKFMNVRISAVPEKAKRELYEAQRTSFVVNMYVNLGSSHKIDSILQLWQPKKEDVDERTLEELYRVALNFSSRLVCSTSLKLLNKWPRSLPIAERTLQVKNLMALGKTQAANAAITGNESALK